MDHFSASPGIVRTYKLGNSDFDSFTGSTDPIVQADLAALFNRLITFSPYFDNKLSWFPNALMYVNAYAIYPGGNFNYDIVTNHPEWILKDTNGNLLHIPWGDNSQYAADISNKNFQNFWLSNVAALLTDHPYKGIFLDDVNLDWRISDASGNFVNPIDPNTNTAMTLTNWRLYMASWLENIRGFLQGKEIVHNSIWYAAASDGWLDNEAIQRQIAAADTVFIEFGVNDGGLTGGAGTFSLDAIFRYIDNIALFDRAAVISNIGGGSVNTAALEYGLAGYYLVNNDKHYAGDSHMAFDPSNWWAGLELNLGQPTNLRINSSGLWQRNYSAGKVFLNEPGATTKTVSLLNGYYKIDGTSVSSLTLAAGQAAIVTRHYLKNDEVIVTAPPNVHYEYGILCSRPNGTLNFFYSAEDQPLSLCIYNGSWSTPIEIGPVGVQPLNVIKRNAEIYLLTFLRNASGVFTTSTTTIEANLADVWDHSLIKLNEANQVIFNNTIVSDIQSLYYLETYYDRNWITYNSSTSTFTITAFDNSTWTVIDPIVTSTNFNQTFGDSLSLFDSIILAFKGTANSVSLNDLMALRDTINVSMVPLPVIIIVQNSSAVSDSLSLSDSVSTNLSLGGTKSITITIDNDNINICIKKFFSPS